MKWLLAIAVGCLFVGLLIGVSRREGSDPEAVRLLKSAVGADQREDFTANATFFGNYRNQLLHSEATIYNARGGLKRIEFRLGSLAGVIVGRTEQGVGWRFDPLERHMFTGKITGEEEPRSDEDLNLMLENYRASVQNHTTIAGRPATEILLQPNMGGGSRSMWIDRDKGVVLFNEERNADNKLVAATRFSSIKYGVTASPDKFLPIPPGSAPVQWHAEDDFATEATTEQIRKTLGMPMVQPTYVPKGFNNEGHYLYRCPGCNVKTAVTRYVNGLNSLTLVQAPMHCAQHMDKRPLDFGLGKAVFIKRGPGYFWVMGELPESELEKVRDSIPVPASK